MYLLACCINNSFLCASISCLSDADLENLPDMICGPSPMPPTAPSAVDADDVDADDVDAADCGADDDGTVDEGACLSSVINLQKKYRRS